MTALRDRIEAAPEGTRDELFLLKLDPAGNGQAIVSIGNPDTATNVATLVPGTANNLGN